MLDQLNQIILQYPWLILFSVFLWAGLVPVQLVLAQSTISADELQTIIQTLKDQITALQAQVIELQSELETVKTELKFTRALSQGLQGDEVKQLQEFLKTIPGVYPEGLTTGYFGPLTEAAVKAFQKKYNIVTTGTASSTGFGSTGPKTRAKINEVGGY